MRTRCRSHRRPPPPAPGRGGRRPRRSGFPADRRGPGPARPSRVRRPTHRATPLLSPRALVRTPRRGPVRPARPPPRSRRPPSGPRPSGPVPDRPSRRRSPDRPVAGLGPANVRNASSKVPAAREVWSRSHATMASAVRDPASSLASVISCGSAGARDTPAPMGSETASTQARGTACGGVRHVGEQGLDPLPLGLLARVVADHRCRGERVQQAGRPGVRRLVGDARQQREGGRVVRTHGHESPRRQRGPGDQRRVVTALWTSPARCSTQPS